MCEYGGLAEVRRMTEIGAKACGMRRAKAIAQGVETGVFLLAGKPSAASLDVCSQTLY